MDKNGLDRVFHAIMRGFVETGRALHYTELAAALELDVESGRQAMHDVVQAFRPSWLFPGTDLIASFAPFNSQPTQYRVSLQGQQRWYAQCGFEALAVPWLFPGERVQIDAPCLDCGEPIVLELRDGALLTVDPPTVLGHMAYPTEGSRERLPFR